MWAESLKKLNFGKVKVSNQRVLDGVVTSYLRETRTYMKRESRWALEEAAVIELQPLLGQFRCRVQADCRTLSDAFYSRGPQRLPLPAPYHGGVPLFTVHGQRSYGSQIRRALFPPSENS